MKGKLEIDFVRYFDSDYIEDRDKMKSRFSYVFTLCGNYISWKSKLQCFVVLSTIEAVIWL